MQIALNKFTSGVRNTNFVRVGLWGLFALASIAMALFFGLLAVTASPILIGMGIGLLVGAFLVMKPDILIWLILLLGLASDVVVSMLGPHYSKITWAVSILGFVLLALSLFSLAMPDKAKAQPAFIWVGLGFLVTALGVTLLEWASTGEVIAGVKRMFQGYGLMFAFAILSIGERDIRRYMKLLLVIAALQLPFALYEFLILVPERGGLALNSATTDVVAGTFGANLDGGSPNSVMALFLLIMVGFLFARWKEKLLSTQALLVLALPMLAVFFLGEVKVLFVLLPIAFVVLLKRDIPRRPGFFILMGLFGLFFIVLLGYLYSVFIIKEPIDYIFRDTLSYNVEDRGYGTYYLNRFSSMTFWWQQQGAQDPVGFLFGHGLGSSFSAPSVVPGHIALRWPSYGIDLTAASSLLWDVGVVGLSLFMLILVAAWRTCSVLQRETRDACVLADVTAIQAAIMLFAVFMIYNNSLVSYSGLEIIYASVLGYLAYLYRQHRQLLNVKLD